MCAYIQTGNYEHKKYAVEKSSKSQINMSSAAKPNQVSALKDFLGNLQGGPQSVAAARKSVIRGKKK